MNARRRRIALSRRWRHGCWPRFDTASPLPARGGSSRTEKGPRVPHSGNCENRMICNRQEAVFRRFASQARTRPTADAGLASGNRSGAEIRRRLAPASATLLLHRSLHRAAPAKSDPNCGQHPIVRNNLPSVCDAVARSADGTLRTPVMVGRSASASPDCSLQRLNPLTHSTRKFLTKCCLNLCPIFVRIYLNRICHRPDPPSNQAQAGRAYSVSNSPPCR